MAIYDNVFRFTIDGNAENGLRAILGEYEKLKKCDRRGQRHGPFCGDHQDVQQVGRGCG